MKIEVLNVLCVSKVYAINGRFEKPSFYENIYVFKVIIQGICYVIIIYILVSKKHGQYFFYKTIMLCIHELHSLIRKGRFSS